VTWADLANMPGFSSQLATGSRMLQFVTDGNAPTFYAASFAMPGMS
jgi:hypothetical protein